MTKTILITIGVFLFFAFSCGLKKSIYAHQKIIQIEDIDSMIISKNSSAGPWKRLTKEQVEFLANRWNKAKTVGPCKYVPKYIIEIYSKTDSLRTFRVNGKTMKESNDWGFNLKDEEFISEIWDSAGN